MKTFLIILGISMAIYGAYCVVYAEDVLMGGFAALLALAIMIVTSDSVWSELE